MFHLLPSKCASNYNDLLRCLLIYCFSLPARSQIVVLYSSCVSNIPSTLLVYKRQLTTICSIKLITGKYEERMNEYGNGLIQLCLYDMEKAEQIRGG